MSHSQSGKRFWWVLVATGLACWLTASLGFWQLRRADFKMALQTAMEDRARLPHLVNADLLGLADTQPLLHRTAELKGRWVPEGTVFLDNRQMGQRQGFYVVTPLRLAGDGRLLYVQRGFVLRDFMDRTHLPEVPTPSGDVTVLGRMAATPSQVYELGEPVEGRIRQNLNIAASASALHAQALNASLVQLEPSPASAPDGLERNWPQVASGVQKHHGYAFQWFGLCALMVFLYVWFQIISPRRQRARSESPHGA